MRYEKHVFICTNQKGEGKACCGEERGMELVNLFREELRNRGLAGKVRAQRSGCLDACKLGPTVVIYPEGTYYGHLSPGDVATLVEEHIVNNRIVKSHELTWENE